MIILKRFSKTFFAIILAVLIIFFAIFAAEKFFGAQLFVLKSYFSGTDGKLPFSDNTLTAEPTSLSELIKNGAVLCDSLMLVNSEYTLPDGYCPKLIDLNGNEVYINESAENAYRGLKTAVRNNFDDSLYIMSSYRTIDEQEGLADSEGEYAASAESSEHLTGLAIDVYVTYHAGMGFLESDAGKFVNENCHEYGFIIRYPYYGESITKIPYEPWHLRYVGFPHSEIIMENKLTLEEYIDSFVPGAFYFYDGYLITRQPEKEIKLPEGISEITISPDNTGFYFITGKY